MDIFTRYCLDGAKQAQGLTVIIDIFRSSNTILALLACGVKQIVVTASVSKARMLKKNNPSWILCGERNRITLSGFAYGNSPAEITAAHRALKGKNVILTTSAGAKGIVSAKHATEIIIGAFANGQAISHYIQKKKPKVLTFVSIGTDGKIKAMEDTACAKFIISLLHGKPLAFSPLKKSILKLNAARELEKLGYGADLSFCVQINTSILVPKVKKKNGLIIITS